MIVDFQIRQAIATNVQNESAEGFSSIIDDAISRGDEHLLPGLGVFLEKWWQQATPDAKQQFSSALQQQFQH